MGDFSPCQQTCGGGGSSGGTDNILGGGPTLHETKLETFLLHLLGAISS